MLTQKFCYHDYPTFLTLTSYIPLSTRYSLRVLFYIECDNIPFLFRDFVLNTVHLQIAQQKYARMSPSKEPANETFPNNATVTISEFERHLGLIHLSQV